VNGQPALTYADFTFASGNGFTLADGQNSFTNIAANYYGTGSATNNLTVNLPANATLKYDANGNLTNDGMRSFSYDAENQLKKGSNHNFSLNLLTMRRGPGTVTVDAAQTQNRVSWGHLPRHEPRRRQRRHFSG
jgi:hypothetical protein